MNKNKIILIIFIIIFTIIQCDLLKNTKQKIFNFFHVHLVMNMYTLNKIIRKDGGTWMLLNQDDLQKYTDIIVNITNQNLKNKKILDLGCGDGVMLKYLHDKYKTISYGVDISKYLQQCDDESFDFIISYGVLVCFNDDDKRKILKHIYRILKKNSYAWIGGNMNYSGYPINKNFIESISYDIKYINEEIVFSNKFYKSISMIIKK